MAINLKNAKSGANLKTVKTLGLTVSQPLPRRADKVIQ
jgi:hypothetical protein